MATGGGARSIVTDDAHVFVYRSTFPNAEIDIYDVADPYAPILQGTLPSPHNDANWLRSMAVKDDRLYLTEQNTSGTFWVADASNPAAPALLGSGLGPVDLYGLAFRNDYVLSINNNAGVKVLDVNTPDAPVFAGAGYPQQGYSVTVAGSRVYAGSDFVDQAADTWTLPGTPGDHEIMIAVGNGHDFSTTKDRIKVQ